METLYFIRIEIGHSSLNLPFKRGRLFLLLFILATLALTGGGIAVKLCILGSHKHIRA